ncbi:MAG TPA: bifunctional DNA-formamidopyrimidine glycosylase/DNA-(apurinic or apyrimidinic site) lyase [Candidatus Acidoferrales bacterium]|jgi:formamidopyrimidine-DNA glycosylase|nr:bifunctional DNA-formamidopyrimidine glycosylase/DNA-(apurinic or apyrimidinic site) lyase [Candidatus Acidoferrales bacterium]
MPELPEVETVLRGLQAALPGRRILEVRLGKTDFIEDPSALETHLPGARVRSVDRHGKFLRVDLESTDEGAKPLALLIHLGMTGQIVVGPPEAPVPPHTHVFLALDDGKEFRYTDIRRFGLMRLLADGAREKAFASLGIDALIATEQQFAAALDGRRARIKAVLLDQSVLAGIGNIYVDESLWRARIHPMRLAATLKRDEIHRLYRAVRDVLNEAIRLRGSSVSDYVDSEGRRGEFQQRHRVYQRTGKKCFRCGAAIRRAIVAGRSSHFCPRCQRAPRTRRPRA